VGNKVMALARSQGHVVFGTYNAHPITGSGWKKADLTDQFAVESVIAETEPDVIINTASITDVDRCEVDVERALAVNGKMPGVIAHVCSRFGSSIVQVSVMLAQKFNFDTSLVIPALSATIGWVARRPHDSSIDVSNALQKLNNKPLSIDAALDELHAEAH